MGQKEEIEYKLTQALMVWKTQGGPYLITVSDATQLAQKIKPGINEYEIKAIVNSSSSLALQSDIIVLNKNLTDLM